MSYQKDRDDFMVQMAQEGMAVGTARAILRDAQTLQRLAELSCSSYAADRDRVRCPGERREADCICDCSAPGTTRLHNDVPRIDVKAQQAERRIARRATAIGFKADCGGDPRGYVVKLVLPSGRDCWVPAKGHSSAQWSRIEALDTWLQQQEARRA